MGVGSSELPTRPGVFGGEPERSEFVRSKTLSNPSKSGEYINTSGMYL